MADELKPGPLPAPNGNVALATQRINTNSEWQSLCKASSTAFDGLITELGRTDLTSTATPIVQPSPDTEISLFTDPSGDYVEAILLESPEPLPWQRIWQWISLLPANAQSTGITHIDILWNNDGTRGLIVPIGNMQGSFELQIAFQGNIGAEAPCITLSGAAVTEQATVGTVALGPLKKKRPPVKKKAAMAA